MALPSQPRIRFAVGTLTRATSYFETAKGPGIAVVEFDPAVNCFSMVSIRDGIDNPTYLSFDPRRKTIYANSEVEGWNEGTVSAYRYDEATASLTYVNKQATLGSLACHNSLDPAGRHLFVANYSHENDTEAPRRAMAVFPIHDDGSLAPAGGSVVHHGSGPDRVRQRVPHPHCAVAVGGRVAVADLGLDAILHYEFDDATGILTTEPCEVSVLPPGSGPRHLAVSGDGSTLYVVNELASSIAVLRQGGDGWKVVQLESTLPPGKGGEANLCAAIQLSPDGRHLLGSNRGHDSLVVFSVDGRTGLLSAPEWVPTRGRTPRAFTFSPDGRLVVVANQNSDEIAAFQRDPDSGELHWLDSRHRLGTPMCVISL